MSLDFYIEGPTEKRECTCYECGNAHSYETEPALFSANITHNLWPMFRDAGVYEILWNGDGLIAGEQVDKLQAALDLMKADPARFEKHNSTNGWGLYKNAVSWLEKVVAGCRESPEGKIRCSR